MCDGVGVVFTQTHWRVFLAALYTWSRGFQTFNLTGRFHVLKVKFRHTLSKKGGKDHEPIQSSTTLDPVYHMGK